MRPEFVLDDDEKRRRFKHLKIGGRKKSENCKVTSTHHKSNKKQMLYGNAGQYLLQAIKPPLAETIDTDEEDTGPLLDLEDVERIHSQLRDNESCLDPETGLVLGQVPAINTTPLPTAGRGVNQGSRSFHSARRRPLLGPFPGTLVKLREGSLTTLLEDSGVELEDQTILKYIHKKFRPLHSMQPPPSGGDSGDIAASALIRSVTIRSSQAMENSMEACFEASFEASFEARLEASKEDSFEDSFENRSQVQQRRSVIVRRQEQEQEQPLDATIDIEFEVRHHQSSS